MLVISCFSHRHRSLHPARGAKAANSIASSWQDEALFATPTRHPVQDYISRSLLSWLDYPAQPVTYIGKVAKVWLQTCKP